jgi:hypothetical protein
MDRCPLCRARLNGADTCRRCRAELGSAQHAEREGQALLDAAIYSLALDDVEAADQLLRRALGVHATLEVRALSQLVVKPARPPGGGDQCGSEAN